MVALALILSSLALSQSSLAQTSKPVLQNFYQPVYVTAFIPCINGGKGENVTFSDTETELFWYSVTGGKRNGFFMSVGGGMHGKGETSGVNYTARGSTQQSFAHWVPFNPDGSLDGEGQFTYTDNYYVNSTTPVTNHIWHRTQRFEKTKAGGVYTLFTHPDEVVCR